ncbi:MAG: hypothetical protein PHR84_04870, partial [Candidatus Omnitrophica bacterium]|nr:hypothetical protein [Candidatus Omnitrophota bacterium]
STRVAIGDNYIDGAAYTWESTDGDGGEVDYRADLIVQENVGIGTANPRSRLEIVGSASNVSALHVNLGDISLRGGNMGNCGIRFFDLTDTNHRIYYSGVTNSLHFDSFAQMYFNQGFYTPGNVGIGITAPTGKLVVRGAGTTTGIGLQTQNSSGTALVTMLDSGNVGIGSINPGSRLEVVGSASNVSALHVNLGDISVRGGNMGNCGIRLFDRTDTNHRIYYSGATNSVHFDSYAQMYFNQGFYTPGNVGIGITTPAEKLHVSGGFIRGQLKCRRVSAVGPAPTYVSRATCNANEWLLSGGGGCSNPTIAYLHESAPYPGLEAWQVDCYRHDGSGDNPSFAYAICCEK